MGNEPAERAMEPKQPPPNMTPGQPPPAPEEPEPPKSLSLLMDPMPTYKSPAHNEVWRTMQWKATIKSWEEYERQYAKALRDWFFNQRSYLLEHLKGKGIGAFSTWFEKAKLVWLSHKDIAVSSINEWQDFAYWLEQEAELKEFSKPIFTAAAAAAGDQLIREFLDLNIVFDADNWNILNTGAIRKIDTRLTKIGGIVDTVRNHVGEVIETSLRDGLTIDETAKLLQEKYNFANNRAKTIARTEVGGVISDARQDGMRDVGIKEQMWSSSRDAKVRASHQIEGEVAKLDEYFSNGLLYPREEMGLPEEVINCRCVAIPMKAEGDE